MNKYGRKGKPKPRNPWGRYGKPKGIIERPKSEPKEKMDVFSLALMVGIMNGVAFGIWQKDIMAGAFAAMIVYYAFWFRFGKMIE